MITVHHLDSSRSQRILWLLEELGAPYDIQCYRRDPTSRTAPDALKRIHPLGKSPVVTDGDLVLAESGLIVEYLCARFPDRKLAPAKSAGIDTAARLRWSYWLHYAEGSAMTPLLLQLLLGPIKGDGVEALKSSFVRRQLKIHVDYWEQALGETGWFAGPDFSAADVMMAFPVEGAARFDALAGQPRLQDFIARVQARDAYRRAAERTEDAFKQSGAAA